MLDYSEFLKQCDDAIRGGKVNDVIHWVHDLNLAQVPRAYAQSLAKICRRVGCTEKGLRLLQPIVRGEHYEQPATDGEKSEYAVLLSRNGSIDEALSLLEKTNKKLFPEAVLYQGFCQISKWEHEKAVPFFLQFLELCENPYQRLIATVNLAACYVVIARYEAAQELVDKIISSPSEKDNRLIGNCLDLRAQIFIHRGSFEEGKADLDRASEIFKGAQTYDRLLIAKWQHFIEAKKSHSVEPISKFRSLAVERKHYESVRDSDLLSLLVEFDQKKFDHLYAGTQYPGYRCRLDRVIGALPSQSFLLGNSEGLLFDLQTGKFNRPEILNAGKKIHQIIVSLLSDFYAPRNVGSLFVDLYPDEYFDVHTSASRVRQVIRRARRYLEATGIPAQILQTSGDYRFEGDAALGIIVPMQSDELHSLSIRWLQLARQFNGSFSASDACSALEISRSSFLRLMAWAEQEKKVNKTGVGKALRYSVVPVSAADRKTA
jgi:tetratricopeptide (TPR) repeat protein